MLLKHAGWVRYEGGIPSIVLDTSMVKHVASGPDLASGKAARDLLSLILRYGCEGSKC